MSTLGPNILSEIIDLLTPFVKTEDDRRTLLFSTLNSTRIISQIEFKGNVEPFILNLTRILEDLNLDSGENALWFLLENIRERVPEEKNNSIDFIQSLIKPIQEVINPKTDQIPQKIRIFISSPKDVADERTIAFSIIDQLQYDPFIRGNANLEVIAWDKPGNELPMIASLHPQESLNKGMPKPAESDIVIVILWSRMGTPFPENYSNGNGKQFLSGTEWEFENALTSANIRGKPLILVYRRTDDVLISVNDEEFLENYEQWKRVNSFFDKFKNPDGSIIHSINTYSTPADFSKKLEIHLRELISRLLKQNVININKKAYCFQNQEKLVTTIQLWNGSPFPGLRAFETSESPVFFGRGAEIDGLASKLANPKTNFIAVIGASGSGKSSLVKAGLIPRLMNNTIQESKRWKIIRFTPDEFGSGDPFLSLAVALSREFSLITTSLANNLREHPGYLETVFIDILGKEHEKVEILLFIDQFEELFTLVNQKNKESFIDFLVQVLSITNLHIVVTLRADFYTNCLEWSKLADLLRDGSYPLAPPGFAALYQMITRPSVRAGLEIETGLAERILEDVGTEPGHLALMAFTLRELFILSQKANVLTIKNYERLGGINGAIGTQAEIVYNTLNEKTKLCLPILFRKLVSVNEEGIATRQRVTLKELTWGNKEMIRFVNVFTNARLLVQSNGEDNQPIVEVAHEALFSNWPLLQNWINITKDDLQLLRQVSQASQEWVRHSYNKAYLWPHERLIGVYQMIERLNLNKQKELEKSVLEFIRPEEERLIDEVNRTGTSHLRRATISDRLAEIGDSRCGIGLDSNGIPDISWCKVQSGKIKLEGFSKVFQVDSFNISKYPITYIQYKSFIDSEDGFYNIEWWNGIPMPSEAGHQYRQLNNHPVENVSWYDAIAFCRWISSRIGFDLRLPTECEWQQAANGGNPANIYPWGAKWESFCCNSEENGLSRTTAVGMYPSGVSPVGAMDMGGNVWEWCLNKPNDPNDCTIEESEKRAVRGGCWYHDKRLIRTTFRNPEWDYSHPRSHLRGFRVITNSNSILLK